MSEQDLTIECIERDCKAPFIFTVGEQQFFSAQGFTPPKRCKGCRAKKKAEKNGGAGAQAAPQPRTVPETPIYDERPGRGGNGNSGTKGRGRGGEGEGRRNKRDFDNF